MRPHETAPIARPVFTGSMPVRPKSVGSVSLSMGPRTTGMGATTGMRTTPRTRSLTWTTTRSPRATEVPIPGVTFPLMAVKSRAALRRPSKLESPLVPSPQPSARRRSIPPRWRRWWRGHTKDAKETVRRRWRRSTPRRRWRRRCAVGRWRWRCRVIAIIQLRIVLPDHVLGIQRRRIIDGIARRRRKVDVLRKVGKAKAVAWPPQVQLQLNLGRGRRNPRRSKDGQCPGPQQRFSWMHPFLSSPDIGRQSMGISSIFHARTRPAPVQSSLRGAGPQVHAPDPHQCGRARPEWDARGEKMSSGSDRKLPSCGANN